MNNITGAACNRFKKTKVEYGVFGLMFTEISNKEYV